TVIFVGQCTAIRPRQLTTCPPPCAVGAAPGRQLDGRFSGLSAVDPCSGDPAAGRLRLARYVRDARDRRSRTMIPAGIPPVAPSVFLSDLFGPLAPIAVFAALAALGVLVALLAEESWRAARRRRNQVAIPAETRPIAPLRPAA